MRFGAFKIIAVTGFQHEGLKAHPSRAIAFLNEIYPPGADTGDEMLTHEGEETGILVEGRLELTVGLETFVLEAGDSYYFESSKPHRFRNPFFGADLRVLPAPRNPGARGDVPWREAMRPVWKKFESDIGPDVIAAAEQANQDS